MAVPMQTLNWLDEHIGSIEDAEHLINEFHWFLNIEEMAGKWTVRSGEETVFMADSREAVDAFIYGMALAYRGLPAHLYAKIFNLLAGTHAENTSTTTDTGDIELDVVDAESVNGVSAMPLPQFPAITFDDEDDDFDDDELESDTSGI